MKDTKFLIIDLLDDKSLKVGALHAVKKKKRYLASGKLADSNGKIYRVTCYVDEILPKKSVKRT